MFEICLYNYLKEDSDLVMAFFLFRYPSILKTTYIINLTIWIFSFLLLIIECNGDTRSLLMMRMWFSFAM